MKGKGLKHHQQKSHSDTNLSKGWLQRTAVREVPENEVESPVVHESGLNRSFVHVPVRGSGLPVVQPMFKSEAPIGRAAELSHKHSSTRPENNRVRQTTSQLRLSRATPDACIKGGSDPSLNPSMAGRNREPPNMANQAGEGDQATNTTRTKRQRDKDKNKERKRSKKEIQPQIQVKTEDVGTSQKTSTDGSLNWPVTFETNATEGWLLQKITNRYQDNPQKQSESQDKPQKQSESQGTWQTSEYWEAWPIGWLQQQYTEDNQRPSDIPNYDDIWYKPERTWETSGKWEMIGEVYHTTEDLSKDMKQWQVKEAGKLYSSYEQPAVNIGSVLLRIKAEGTY
ncbi:MAG: hypothetical protein F6J98_16815 [Moorea sp. SIO4G2]|nr:hypothetical protein [Moorena sp. SIO4G2]